MGTWQLGDDSQVVQAIKDAIDVGYRHIDTAYRYDNEKGIGIALRQAIVSRRVKREDMFITSKVWNNMHSRPKVIESINASLKNLVSMRIKIPILIRNIKMDQSFRERGTKMTIWRPGRVWKTPLSWV
jgi:diketogulonate reductase-like aldo/keto reductase